LLGLVLSVLLPTFQVLRHRKPVPFIIWVVATPG
jgi:hypothetical protein